MKKLLVCLAVLLFSITCFAQRNEQVVALVKEGIELHDKGDYTGAIQKYDEAIKLDPNDYDANYEKSLTLYYAKKYVACIALSKTLLEKFDKTNDLSGVYSNYGSTLDDMRDMDEAIKVYDRGLNKYPNYYLLHFNKGLTLIRKQQWDDALTSFFNALQQKPNHPGSLYYAALLQEKSNKIAALMSGLVFLAAEPEGKRAELMYKKVQDIIGSFAQRSSNGNNVITINAGDLDSKKKENNFSTTQMILGLSAASSLTDSVKAKTEADKLSLMVQMMTNSLSEGRKAGKGIYWKTFAPFFIEMKEKDLMNSFAHIAAITSGKEENTKWINDNQDKLNAFYDWYNGYEWIK